MNNQLTEKELFCFLSEEPTIRNLPELCEYVSGYFGREMSKDVTRSLKLVLKKFKRVNNEKFIAKRVKFKLELLLESASEDVIVVAYQMKPIAMKEEEDDKVETPTCKLKSWNELSKRHKLRHIQPSVDLISELAVKFDTTPEEVCLLIIERVQNLEQFFC